MAMDVPGDELRSYNYGGRLGHKSSSWWSHIAHEWVGHLTFSSSYLRIGTRVARRRHQRSRDIPDPLVEVVRLVRPDAALPQRSEQSVGLACMHAAATVR